MSNNRNSIEIFKKSWNKYTIKYYYLQRDK